MAMRMLIDARHPEETRVAVVKGNRIEEFDFESADHKQLKGNIYLAKVTRVEPSLQAAFVDYGGNRHGFLAFSEIHPDYYRIPQEDREALLREEAEHHAEEEALRARRDAELEGDEGDGHEEDEHDDEHLDDEEHEEVPVPSGVGGQDDAQADALRSKRMSLRRRYKIQDVIVRRQMLLVQVVKEERGNKGAALTTYLSLAGRYCVLMPNTSHGGGISRKISNAADRKRLKSIMSDLQLPPSMGCIVRTAGLQRTKTEIKRDFDYLTRLWDGIREHTLTATAPALIHEDSDLLKRAIRDIYNRDIDEVVVEGEEGFRHARSFMKMLMPSHAKKVTPYVDPVPLFQRQGVEGQLEGMYQPVVQLKSGGYIVINPTEALVSIDINSGRSTREHNIEETALKTNLEAADEIARQLRLRDMAGLVVIDFIDMEVGSNVRKVERAMKEALKNDRARIQIGRISSFGLMEMSRQRLRTGMLEASTHSCPTCQGTGLVRNIPSAALSALRALEEEAVRGRASEISLRAGQEVVIYILNRKRSDVAAIEATYGVSIEVLPDATLIVPQYAIDASGPPPVRPALVPKQLPLIEDDDLVDDEDDEEAIAAEEAAAEAERRGAEGRQREEGEGGEHRRGRRRRRRRGGRRDEGEQGVEEGTEAGTEEDEATAEPAEQGEEAAGEEHGEGRRRRRRGRRGGRRHSGEERGAAETVGSESAEAETVSAPAEAVEPVGEPSEIAEATPITRRRPRARKAAPELAPELADAPKPAVAAKAPPAAEEPVPELEAAEKPKRRSRRKTVGAVVEAEPVVEAALPITEEAPAEESAKPAAKPRRARASRAKTASLGTEVEAEVAKASPAPASEAEPAEAAPETDDVTSPRRGWWQRTFGE